MVNKKVFTNESLQTFVNETKAYINTKIDESKVYTDENIEMLNEGFSEVIYQMYADDLTEDGAPTIRQIANDEASKALGEAKTYVDNQNIEVNNKIDEVGDNFSEIIIGMYGDDSYLNDAGDSLRTIRNIANDEANNALGEAKEYTNTSISSLIDNMVFITVDDIDEICGTIIQVADERVTF